MDRRRRDDGLTLEVTVPGNTTATVRIPALNPSLITESGKALGQADHVSGVVDEGATVAMTVASGTYKFVVAPPPIGLTAAAAAPASGEPGTATTVSALVKNRSAAPITGRLEVGTPAGWPRPDAVGVGHAGGGRGADPQRAGGHAAGRERGAGGPDRQVRRSTG